MSAWQPNPPPPDRDNEDFAAATTDAAIVIHGAGTPAGAESECAHSVAWYARNLGSALIANLADPDQSITGCLASAIDTVNASHGTTCDLDHPGTPSATVTAIRKRDDHLEYLVLADSPSSSTSPPASKSYATTAKPR